MIFSAYLYPVPLLAQLLASYGNLLKAKDTAFSFPSVIKLSNRGIKGSSD